MAAIAREATPLLELGDQDSLRFDDLSRLRMATFAVDCGKRLGFAAHAPGFRATFMAGYVCPEIRSKLLSADLDTVMRQHGAVFFPPARAGSSHVV